jgi:DNA-binding beta-propeller fold protein YncE
MKSLFLGVGTLLVGVALASGQASTNFFNWETSPVHPIALSPGGTTLVACNLPDNRLEVFDVTAGKLNSRGSVTVGLDPVSVRFWSEDEVWVVNFISDSVSIVSLSAMRVVATLNTLNEPSDIVFAGPSRRAFVSCAQPNVVQVFNPTNRAAITNLVIDGNRPRAMAVSPNGTNVYVAIFESGNASTIIGSGVSLGFPLPTPIDFPEGPYGGQNPFANSGTNFNPAISANLGSAPPRVSLIVKKNGAGKWMDDNHGDWSQYITGTNAVFTGRPVGWDLPDHDVAIIDTGTMSIRYLSGLMNICMDIAANPATGKIAVVGTDALNEIRFEPVLNGIFVRVKLALADVAALTNRIGDLNAHLNYLTNAIVASERVKSLGDPRGIVWRSDGARGYVTGMGSDNLVVIDANGQRVGATPAIQLGQGPVGMALDELRNRLYVLNRFAATISVVDTASDMVVDTVPLFDPTPTVIKAGRKHLYDTHKTSGLGQAACASCHLDARFDRLAWDLGSPPGEMKFLTNANYGRFPPSTTNHFHPMKGPMTTQTLQDIIGHEPLHWRGDRDGFEQFNSTFTNLQAAASALTSSEVQEFKDFLATIRFPPNPFRNFDNTLPNSLSLTGHVALGRGTLRAGSQLPNGNALSGQTRFRLQGTTGCIHCHTLPSGVGTDMRWSGSQWLDLPLSTNGEHHAAYAAIERSSILPFKIQSLRNLYDKLGMDFTRTSNHAGFGFFHDGSVDTLTRFVQDGFDLRTDQETADLVAFLLAFTGSDLIVGSRFDPDRPPGLFSKDTHAAVGRQITINSSNSVALIDTMISLATSANGRVDLIAKGTQDNLNRAWFYNRTTTRFQSDRLAETLSPAELRQLATVGAELTYTVVPRGSGQRIGIDRDEDGYFDRDELDFGSDPTNPLSLATNQPPLLTSIPDQTIFGGQTLKFTVTAIDPDIPTQHLAFTLSTNAPDGATIATNGQFMWTPGVAQTPSTNTINVTVTDDGSPNQSDTRSFVAIVWELRLGPVIFDTNGMNLSWTAIPGQTYRIQFKNDLNDPNWTPLGNEVGATNHLASVLDAIPHQQRFYRILLVE